MNSIRKIGIGWEWLLAAKSRLCLVPRCYVVSQAEHRAATSLPVGLSSHSYPWKPSGIIGTQFF